MQSQQEKSRALKHAHEFGHLKHDSAFDQIFKIRVDTRTNPRINSCPFAFGHIYMVTYLQI